MLLLFLSSASFIGRRFRCRRYNLLLLLFTVQSLLQPFALCLRLYLTLGELVEELDHFLDNALDLHLTVEHHIAIGAARPVVFAFFKCIDYLGHWHHRLLQSGCRTHLHIHSQKRRI